LCEQYLLHHYFCHTIHCHDDDVHKTGFRSLFFEQKPQKPASEHHRNRFEPNLRTHGDLLEKVLVETPKSWHPDTVVPVCSRLGWTKIHKYRKMSSLFLLHQMFSWTPKYTSVNRTGILSKLALYTHFWLYTRFDQNTHGWLFWLEFCRNL